jgi:hypothetical protein
MQAHSGDVSRGLDDLRAQRIVESVVASAHFAADLTAAFLRSHGVPRPGKRRATSAPSAPEDDALIARAKGFLLNLGAALRIVWRESSGLGPVLPAGLPTSSEAFRNLIPPEVNTSAGGTSWLTSDLSNGVLDASLRYFSRSSLGTIGADVHVPAQAAIPTDELLEGLADLLWANRHLGDLKEG